MSQFETHTLFIVSTFKLVDCFTIIVHHIKDNNHDRSVYWIVCVCSMGPVHGQENQSTSQLVTIFQKCRSSCYARC